MKHWFNRIVCVLILPIFSLAQAAPIHKHEAVKQTVSQYTQGKVIINEIEETAIPGILEAVAGQDVFYIDNSGRYGFVDGRLIDLKTQKDLTALKLEKLNRIDFKLLPLDLAIKTVRGNGKNVIAIFEDPLCPVCRSLHKFISQLDNVTIYSFLYPIVSPESVNKAQTVWCSVNRENSLAAAMAGEELPLSQPCDSGNLDKVITFGNQLNVIATPTVFLANGQRLVGATPPDQFILALEKSTNESKQTNSK